MSEGFGAAFSLFVGGLYLLMINRYRSPLRGSATREAQLEATRRQMRRWTKPMGLLLISFAVVVAAATVIAA